MFRRLTNIILIFKYPLFLILIFLTLIFALAMFRLRIDPSVETLFNKRTEEYLLYREVVDRYGSDQMIVLTMSTPDLFEMKYLRLMTELSETISRLRGVERVVSLSRVTDVRHRFLGVKVVPALEGVLEGERSLEKVRKEILANPLYLHNLVSPDGKNANLLIFLKPLQTVLERSFRGRLIHELQQRLAKEETPGLKFYMAGAPVEQYEFIRLIRRDQFIFIPLIVLLLVATILLIYRSFSCLVLSMSIVLMTLVWSLGTIALFGYEINLVTSLLAPVIMIVTIANVVHIMNLFFEIRPHHASLRKCIAVTMSQLSAPNFLTHLTTVLGFSSLGFNSVPAIQQFGIFAALGTAYSYIVHMLLTPILLPILPYRVPRHTANETHFFNRFLIGFLEQFEFRWKWWIVLFTCGVLVLSVTGISRLQVDTNLIRQMKPDSTLAVATRFIDEHVTGVYSLSVIFKKKDGTSFRDHATLKVVDQFKDFLENRPEITHVNSVTTVIKKINQARENRWGSFRIPRSRKWLGRYFEGMLQNRDPQLWSLISPDFKEIRLEARMRAVGTQEGAWLEEGIRRYLKEKMAPSFDYEITGNIVLLGKMAKNLVTSQLQGFAAAFLSILAVITVVFKSLRIGLLAAIPNVLPVLAVYGLMGFLPIELSTPTAMISSIALGMVVDASIHFLHRFGLEFSFRGHYLTALHHTYRNVGQSLVISTMILVTGFATSAFASFRPTIHFGALTSCAIFFALVCTLMVLPVFIVVLKPFGKQRLFKSTPHPHYRVPGV